MNTDQNDDRDARYPSDIPDDELSNEIAEAHKKLWEIGFHSQIGSVIQQTMDARKARLSVLLSMQADIQTRRIVRLTWALLIFTAALFALTAYLCYDAYAKAHADKQEQQDNSKPRQASP